MDSDKPFKTIEVIDSRTRQTCKIACMSCIRGHRTTSCGIPVCRTKVFWTVKRPGRPSRSCTCRYGATGGCKCGVARTACPHKPKKGEKRSGDCRCDEQGRYCCLVEPQHWSLLLTGQNPIVVFYPTPEALETRSLAPHAPPTPAASINTPLIFPDMSEGPATPGISQHMQDFSFSPVSMQSPPVSMSDVNPNFGLAGVASMPNMSLNGVPWQSQVPFTPIQPFQQARPQPVEDSCCARRDLPSQSMSDHVPYSAPPAADALFTFGQPNAIPDNMTVQPGAIFSTFNFDKLADDYLHYQFPSAICQTCGLSGCTCRNCPPVMQNFNTGSWAQCCGRKHARTASYVPEVSSAMHDESGRQIKRPAIQAAVKSCCGGGDGTQSADTSFDDLSSTMVSPPVTDGFDYSDVFDVDHDEFAPVDSSRLSFSDLLMSELDRPPDNDQDGGGCCCGD